jgi:hypothetical protein
VIAGPWTDNLALNWAMRILGLLLMLFVLLDVFLTVLYARVGTGVISHPLACYVWRIFRFGTKPLRRGGDLILSLCAPIMLVLLVMTWVLGLVCGAAMIIQPSLGSSITSSSGDTPKDFFTAMYIAGDTMSTVGTSDIAPRNGFFRLFYMINSFVGMFVITLTVTYFLEIYNALQRRNTFALKLHLASGETGDAAELLAGLGPHGHFESGYTHLAEIGAEMASFKESHHFYSVLLYFRFREPHYAVSRLALVTLDTVSLIKSALDDREYGWLKESAAVAQLWRGSMHLMTLLGATFLPKGLPDPVQEAPDDATLERWRRRYFAAARRLRQAGIQTNDDEQNGAETYIALRARWDRHIAAIAEHMAHDYETIDPAGTDPESIDERQDFRTRLRSAG